MRGGSEKAIKKKLFAVFPVYGVGGKEKVVKGNKWGMDNRKSLRDEILCLLKLKKGEERWQCWEDIIHIHTYIQYW